MNSSAKMHPTSLMSLWGVTWWTCMQTVGAMWELGELFWQMQQEGVQPDSVLS